MTNLRRLRPLVISKSRQKNNPGEAPQPILLKLSQLRINDEYQRQISRDSGRLAAKITCEFDWGLYHLPVVSLIEGTDEITGLPLYEVLDGQHTSIAAVTNGHIREIWCWPGREGETVEDRATSFAKLNTQRTGITPVELFWAKVKAGDEDSLKVLAACEKTGASIIKRPKPYGDMKVGETICVDRLVRIAALRGQSKLERILEVAMSLRLSPINLVWIQALELVLIKEKDVNHIAGVPSTVNLMIENTVGNIGQENLIYAAKMSHANMGPRERQALFWWLAYHIKKEVTRDAEARGSRITAR